MNPGSASVMIRAMTAADLDRVLKITGSLETAPQWPRAVYEQMLDSAREASGAARRIALVAHDAETGSIAGFLVASLMPPEAELETVGVALEFQRRGIGRRLMAELEERLLRCDVTKVLLEVRNSNGSARSFYRASGFVEIGQRRAYYVDPVEDAVVMQLGLGAG